MKAFKIDGIFPLEIPGNWAVETGEVTAIYNPDGGSGALQFSFYRIDAVIDVGEFLQLFLHDHFEGATPILTHDYAWFEGVDENEVYWRYWLFRKPNGMALATYNCAKADKDKEFGTVNDIIKSLI